MPNQFFQDTSDMKKLKKFYKKAPKAFQRVSAGTLNGLAFEERTNFQKSIKLNMMVRSPGLLKKLTRVKTTSKSTPISKQKAETFTVTMARHEGWEAANKGGAVPATEFTDEGRAGGKPHGKSLKGARRGGAFTGPQDLGYSGRMSKRQIREYLQRISMNKKRRRKSFYLPVWFKRMAPGIYRFKGGKVSRKDKQGRMFKRPSLHGARFQRLSNQDQIMRVDSYDWQDEATVMTTKPSVSKRIWVVEQDRELRRLGLL